uniref:Secreted protein n=1 Tax=Macrostomum lignano TaxID=282301 RepID=A0A1I8JQD3_9PLAT
MTKLLLLLSAALMAVNLLSHSASARRTCWTHDELDKADIKTVMHLFGKTKSGRSLEQRISVNVCRSLEKRIRDSGNVLEPGTADSVNVPEPGTADSVNVAGAANSGFGKRAELEQGFGKLAEAWKADFGKRAGPGTADSVNVPELGQRI